MQLSTVRSEAYKEKGSNIFDHWGRYNLMQTN